MWTDNQGFLQPGVLHLGVPTTRGSHNEGSYIQGFLQPGVLQPGVPQSEVLTIRVLQLGVLTIIYSYNCFLEPGVLQPGGLTTISSYKSCS